MLHRPSQPRLRASWPDRSAGSRTRSSRRRSHVGRDACPSCAALLYAKALRASPCGRASP
eukprot:6633816-Prymnesium_polylepis.1